MVILASLAFGSISTLPVEPGSNPDPQHGFPLTLVPVQVGELKEELGIFWQKSRLKLGWKRIHNMVSSYICSCTGGRAEGGAGDLLAEVPLKAGLERGAQLFPAHHAHLLLQGTVS
jgi:hypothetical protein